MSDKAKFHQWMGTIGSVAGVIGLLLSYLAIRSSWDIAERSGDFERPVITLGLAGTRLKDAASVTYGAEELCDNENVAIATLPFTLVNEGQNSVSDATLTFRYDHRLKREALNVLQSSIAGLVNAADVRNLVSTDGNFDYAAYSHASLNPGVALIVEEPLRLWNMDDDITQKAVSKDGVEFEFSFRLGYSIVFQATTNGRDTPARNYSITLHGQCATSINDLVKQTVEKRIPEEAETLRRDVGFWRYLGAFVLRHSQGQRRQFVVWQKLEKNSDGGEAAVFFPDKQASVAIVDYNVLSVKHVL